MQQEQPQMQQTPAPQAPASAPKKSSGSKLLIVLLIVLGVILVAVVGAFMYAKSTPQYSLYKMDQAVKSKDYETFSKYFNVDAVIDDLLDKALEASKQEIAKTYPSGSQESEVAQKYAKDLLDKLAPQMKKQAKEEIKKQVESGKFIEDYSQPNIINAFTNTKVKMEGNDAVVTVTDPKTKNSVSFRMRKKASYWEIYKIDMTLEELQKMSQ